MRKAALEFRLLGGHLIRHNDENITLSLPHKGRALLVYLLLTGKTHSRKKIATYLWPQAAPEKSQRSLRVLLNALRNKHHLTPYFQSRRLEIGLDFSQSIWCDVLALQKSVEVQLAAVSPNMRVLQDGMDLYLGKFMLGFDVTNTPFDDWMLQQQIKLEELALRGLATLIQILDAADNPRAATEYAYRLVEIDPWREVSYRWLMRVLTRCDRADAALYAYEQCCEILERELGVTPEKETESLAARIRQGRIAPVQSEPPAVLPELPDVPFLVPAETGPFVGRQQVMNRLQMVLAQVNSRSRTCLTGMGGIGKTTVALHLAHQMKAMFPDGVLWGDVAHQEQQSIAEAWASAYGYDLHHVANERERLLALRTILTEKQALIIVDDVTNAATVRPLLPENGPGKVLLTSRNEDMARLLDALPVRLEGLGAENGRSLLFHYIDSDRAAREPQAVEKICRLLHNLPLALVITGNYLLERPQLRLTDFAALLEGETRKLDISHADRQVRASFNLSWEALHPQEKLWFRLLGVFNGRSFTVDAFAVVAELDPWVTEAQLQNLVQLSLLNRVEDGRFRQHPLLAEFVREKLSMKDDAYLRMVAYYRQYAIEHQANYERLQPEWENLNAGIETAFRLHQWPAVLQLSEVLQPAWFARGRYTDARQAFAFANKAAMYQEDEKAVADIYFKWGQACLEQSDYQQAEEQFGESLALYKEIGDDAGIGNVQYERARIAINRGDYDVAESQLLSSQNIHERLQNRIGVANVLYRLARLHHRKEQYEEARALCDASLSIHESIQNIPGVVKSLRLLTTITTMVQDYVISQQYAERSLQLAQTINDSGEIAMAYYSLSMANQNINELDQALIYVDKSLILLERMGDRHSQALALYQKCLVYKSMANYELALEAADAALPSFELLEDRLHIVLVLGHSGDCLSKLTQHDAACSRWKAALRIAESIQNARLIKALRQRLASCEIKSL